MVAMQVTTGYLNGCLRLLPYTRCSSGVKISNLHILDITSEATSENTAKVRTPITADINVKLPGLGEIVDLALSLLLQFCVSVETDEETGVSQVVMEECKNNQHSISLTLLGSHTGLLNEVVDFAINLLNEVLSPITHYEVCPVIRSLPESLDADHVKNHID
ncbi:short palate, lung and nasal epithelium carcinoma-associated protein 2A-like [Dama dama]|uniref:short palate, lung and nasal epithelium carcinoma-associated protein 2A-like n=1 Tax=Dama dama TaxID=30532 RepID=UPI002A371E8E|nr:short palate, lung and nasal epithelium carcinoma-associated protein 2A-like [Dama dama]